jgi:hypothetical protein
MKKTLWRVTLIVLALAVMLPAGLGLAAGSPEDVAACSGDNVQGTIIAVDENGVLTIDTGSGLCTVTLNGNYSHPIVTLLGRYFGDIQVGDYSGALQGATGCATVSGGTGAWSDCSAEGAVPIQFVSFDETTMTLTAIVVETGETITIPIDDSNSSVVDSINQALENLMVDWGLDGNGDVVQVSDQIAMYHDEGMGFGVLVKLYSLSLASGVPVDELIAKFKGDPTTGEGVMGLGQLFKEYGGKPPLLGVGHVRKALNNSQGDQTTTDDTTGDVTATGQTTGGNGNGQGNGNGNNNGQGNNNGNGNGKNKPKNNPSKSGTGNGQGNGNGNSQGGGKPNCIPKDQAKPNTPPQKICP